MQLVIEVKGHCDGTHYPLSWFQVSLRQIARKLEPFVQDEEDGTRIQFPIKLFEVENLVGLELDCIVNRDD